MGVGWAVTELKSGGVMEGNENNMQDLLDLQEFDEDIEIIVAKPINAIIAQIFTNVFILLLPPLLVVHSFNHHIYNST